MRISLRVQRRPSNFTKFFTEYYQTPTNYNEHNIRWSNVICDMIIPQRTTMAGWCVILFELEMLVNAVKNKKTSYFIILELSPAVCR